MISTDTCLSLHLLWWDKYDKALYHMMNFRQSGVGMLMEIAAEHSLKDRLYPAEELQARLGLGIKLYKEFSLSENVKFYIPGLKHQENGNVDFVSLSEAGKNYLVSKGIPEEIILQMMQILQSWVRKEFIIRKMSVMLRVDYLRNTNLRNCI